MQFITHLLAKNAGLYDGLRSNASSRYLAGSGEQRQSDAGITLIHFLSGKFKSKDLSRNSKVAPIANSNTDELYRAQWKAWAEKGAADEGRKEALRRLELLLPGNRENLGQSTKLDLSNLGLSSLPEPLPSWICDLDVSANKLDKLPQKLPNSLQKLNVSENRLVDLPQKLPDSLQKLVAFANNLISLPEKLPESLTYLAVSNNQLATLPPTLPNSLEELYAFDNRLESLPPKLPQSLRILEVNTNKLARLPEDLPASLQKLHAAFNQLVSLPAKLPESLQEFSAMDNQLTSLPPMLTSWHSSCVIDLERNPLSQSVIANLQNSTNRSDYTGPRVYMSMQTPEKNKASQPLQDVVASWYGEQDRQGVIDTWKNFARESEAQAFKQFLRRLSHTVNNERNPQFKKKIVEWLDELRKDEGLRQITFALSFGANDTCEDRVSVVFNDMKKVRLAAAINKGEYDDKLPDLIDLARGMFRLDMLEKIAREKVKTLKFVDEIEVYLAYQVKLRAPLKLDIDTEDMRFYLVSGVTEEDLNHAAEKVKESEEKNFFDYLSTQWTPWKSVLQRLAQSEFNLADKKFSEKMADEFANRLNKRLEESNLQNDDDAERTLGPIIMQEINREVFGELTEKFLIKHNLKL